MEPFAGVLEAPFMCGIIFMIAALVQYIFPPGKINPLYGYRTAQSMASQQQWDFAQKYSTIRLAVCGFILVLISLAGLLNTVAIQWRLGLGMTCIAVSVIYLLVATERALAKNFPKQ